MRELVKNLCNSIINNYRKSREDFRFDGEYVNHFASLYYSNIGKEFNIQAVKEIRKYFINNTSRMSCFRGDILYLVSFLISNQTGREEFIKDTIKVYEELKEVGFEESNYLVLASYIIVKYSERDRIELVEKNMYKLFTAMKEKFPDITGDEDYIASSMLAIEGVGEKEVLCSIDRILKHFNNNDMFSNNSVQGLIMALLINKNNITLENVEELLLEFENRDMRIRYQFLPFIGIVADEKNIKKYLDEVEEISKYLCEEEFEFEYYMDKSFREFISTAIIEFSKEKRAKYINETIAMCVYMFLSSKNQGIFSEILA